MAPIRHMIDIFNRDIEFIYRINSCDYRIRLIQQAIDFYIEQMSLPENHPSKFFSNENYELLIKLYREELSKFYGYNIFE